MSPVWHQAISWTNTDLLSIRPLGTNFSEIQFEIKKKFINENAFENVICKMATILSRGMSLNGFMAYVATTYLDLLLSCLYLIICREML